MCSKYTELVVVRPWQTLALALVVAVAFSAGTALLGFRSDERVFFSKDNPELTSLEAFEARYGRDDNGVLVLRTEEGDIFSAQRLRAIAQLVETLWRTPFVKRVDSPTNFQIALGDADGLTIDHVWRLGDPATPSDLERIRNLALGEPLLRGRLLSDDGKTALVTVSLRIPEAQSEHASAEVLRFLRDAATRFRDQHPDFTVGVSGSVALDEAFGEASMRDGTSLTPMMFTLILALLAGLLWSLPAVLAALLVIAGAIGAALGTGGFLGIPLTSVSVASPYIITIIALADTVHLAFSAARRRRQGDSRRNAVRGAMQQTAWPIFLTSVTTAAGFFSLVFSESPPFAHLGVLSGLGSLFAWVFSMTVTPALLIIMPWRAPGALSGVDTAFRSVARTVARAPLKVAVISLAVAGGATAFIGQNKLDDRYIRYFDDDFEFRRDTDFLNRHLGGFYTLDFDLKAGESGGVSDPTYLADVDHFAQWTRAQPGVSHVSNHADRMRMLNRALSGGAPAHYVLPADRSVAAQYLALYEMHLPAGLDLKEQVTADKSASRMTVALEDLSTAQVLALARRARDWIDDNAPGLHTSKDATGTTLMFSYIGMRNINEMILGTAVAFVVIGALVYLAFRNLATTGVAMVTNVTPALVALGGWGLLVGEVGMAVATIVAVTLGIVVDDTIHLVAAIRRGLGAGHSAVQAVENGLVEAGPGIAATTLCLAAGFFCLSLSGFQINAWIGLMSAIVALVAFAFDLFFLPAAMLLIARRQA